MKYQKILLKIIEEEIDRFILEQVAPPAAPPTDPAAAPPADPAATPADPAEQDTGGEDAGDELSQAIEKLAAKTPIDIKKTLLASLQNGAEKNATQTLVAYVTNKTKQAKQGDQTKEVPENIEKAVQHIVKTFSFKVPEKAKEEAEEKVKEEEESSKEEQATTPETPAAPAAPAPPAAPVKESRLQTSLREYLSYKQLSKKVKQ